MTLSITNTGVHPIAISVNDRSYNKGSLAKKTIPAKGTEQIVIDLQDSFGWYDFAITSANEKSYLQRFAGRIETGKESYTDPPINRS